MLSNGTVARYDIPADRAEAIDLGATPNDLVFAGGSLWVAVDESELEASADREAEAEPTPVAEEAAEPVSDVASPPLVSLAPGSLLRIDRKSGEIRARVAISSPKLLASDRRSVWVFGGEGPDARLVRVEAATNAVTRTFDAAGVVVSGLAVAGGSLWLADARGSAYGESQASLYRLRSGASAAEPVTFTGADGEPLSLSGEHSLAAGSGSLWASALSPDPDPLDRFSPTGLYRIDPTTGEVLVHIDDADEVVAYGPGFLWAVGNNSLGDTENGLRVEWADSAETTASYSGALIRINIGTLASVPVKALEFGWADFAVADGDVWASGPEDGAIVRLDPATGEEQERIPVGQKPLALATGGGAVWAALGEGGAVARYDIAADRVKTIDVGGTPIDLVFAGDSLWVAVDNRLTVAEYTSRAQAICEAAEARLRGEIEELDAAGIGDEAFNEFAVRWAEKALVELRAVPPPEAVRVEFERDYSLLERDIEALRLWAEGKEHPASWTPAAHSIQQSLQGCTAGG